MVHEPGRAPSIIVTGRRCVSGRPSIRGSATSGVSQDGRIVVFWVRTEDSQMSTAAEHIAGWQAAGLIDDETADRLRAAEAADQRRATRSTPTTCGRVADVRTERPDRGGLRLSRWRLRRRGVERVHGTTASASSADPDIIARDHRAARGGRADRPSRCGCGSATRGRRGRRASSFSSRSGSSPAPRGRLSERHHGRVAARRASSSRRWSSSCRSSIGCSIRRR